MKLLLLLALFLFLLPSFLLAKDNTSQAPRVPLTPGFKGVKDEKQQPNESLEESQPFKPDPPWISMYIPVRSCHRKLTKEYGEFSPPEYLNDFEGNIWCNWTVWAGSRKNIVIYITGFKSDEGCDKNENKIFFDGVSSLAENTVVYACWGKETHTFATYAKAVHVIFMRSHPSRTRKEGFVGKYYIFEPKRTSPASNDPLGSTVPSLELVLAAITSIPQSKEEYLLFTFNYPTAHISQSQEGDNSTDLDGSLQTVGKNAIATAITDLARKSENLHLLSTASKGSENSSCTLNPYGKLIGIIDCVSWRMGNEETPVGLGESITSSSVVSDVSYLEAHPVVDMGHPRRMLSSPWGLSTNDHQWVRNQLAQQDYLATTMPSLIISSSMVTLDRKSPGAIMYQSFGGGQLGMYEATSRSIVDLAPTSLSSLGHNYMVPTNQNNNLLVSVIKDEWETQTVLVLKNSAQLWSISPITETIVEATSQLKDPFTTALPSSALEVELNLRPRSSYHEQSSTNPSLYLASKMPSGTNNNVSLDAPNILQLDLTTKQEPFLSPRKIGTTPLATAEPVLSSYVALRMEDALSLPARIPTTSLFYNTEPTPPLTLPQPPSLELEHPLSPSMTVMHPSQSVRPHQTLPRSAFLQKSALLEREPGIFSARELDVSLNVGQLESVPMGLGYATIRTALTLQTPFGLKDISPAASVLEPGPPEDILPAAEASFLLMNEATPSLGVWAASTIEKEVILSSACCQHMVNIFKQKDTSLVASPTAGLSSHHTDLEHQEHLIKQLLLGVRENCFGTISGEGEKGDTAKPWNIITKSKPCSSLDRFSLSPNSALSPLVPEMPLVSLPLMSNEKQSANMTQCDLVITSTAALPLLACNEMWTPAEPSVPLEEREEGREQIKEPIKSWGKLRHAKWQWGAMECVVADLDDPGTLIETPVPWENLDLPALQEPSSLDNKVAAKVGLHLNCRELGFPWLQVYLPIKSCHVVLKKEVGVFSPPILSRSQTNNWCNWTIWAGPRKHILIYIDGFEGGSDCEENQDKIIFQGVSSSVESKVAYACRNHGTLVFATQAVAVHVVFLSKSPSQHHSDKHFKGRYYTFADYEAKETFAKSNRSAGLPHESYIMHLGHILDKHRTSKTPTNDSWLSAATKKNWEGNDSAGSLEEVLSPAVGSHTQISSLKSKENETVDTLAMKKVNFANPSIHDTRIGNESSSSKLKKMLGFRSNHLRNEEKSRGHNLSATSTPAHVSQKLNTTTKLVKLEGQETTTEPAHLQDGDHTATRPVAKYTEDAVKTLGKVAFKNKITFPQVLIEEQRFPAISPKSVLEKRHNQSFQSNSGLSRKNIDVEYQQPRRLKETLRRQQIDNQGYREENNDSNMAVVLAGNNKSPLITEASQSPINKITSQLTSLDYSNVLHDLSLRALNHSLAGTASTLSPHVDFSHNMQNINVDMTVIPHPSHSVTRYQEQPQRKDRRTNPPYFSSGSESRINTFLKVGNNSNEDRESVFRSHANDSVLLSQHNPGDLLFEIIFGVEHKGRIPPIGSSQEKTLIEFIKRQVQRKVKPFSSKVKEIKLKEIMRRSETQIDGQTDPDLMLMFWLHLTPKKENASHLVHSQLENLSGTSVEVGKVQTVLVMDVNECNSGIGLCGDVATCLNGYGTYLCKCKEDYEDRSEAKSGTLCVRSPRSGLAFLFSYTEILVGTTVFFISALIVVISVLCAIIKKRRTKKDVQFQGPACPGGPGVPEPQQTGFDQNNICHLLTLDPAQLKLRAKAPEWPLELRSGPSETYRVSVEQSDYL